MTEQVSFVVAGTQKGGTSALDSYLRRHPQICLPKQTKEVHYFDNDEYFRAGEPDASSYRAAFDLGPTRRLLGEATPIYMYWKPVPERMQRYNPAMKIIMLLRNPITRAYSHWNHERQAGREPLSFFEALLAEPERARLALPQQLRRNSYIDRGFYTQQLARMWRHFPAEQTLVLGSEELQSCPDRVLASIADFLGVAAFPETQPKTVFASPYQRAMTVEEKNYLVGVFHEEVRELEHLLGWDCGHWLV